MTPGMREMLDLKIQELAVKYLQRTALEMVLVRGLVANFQDADGAATLASIGALAHRIHGSAAMFGFGSMSTAAGAIEDLASAIEAQGIDRAAAMTEHFTGLLETLDAAVRSAMRDRGISAE